MELMCVALNSLDGLTMRLHISNINNIWKNVILEKFSSKRSDCGPSYSWNLARLLTLFIVTP